uniref:CHK kinase-like domain-containing protein n=1 Tax=Timema poppense TaxID=170557 RepID=A0A7R9DG78_TIMPO|nr:unnamed protein product [Timema poppensis]
MKEISRFLRSYCYDQHKKWVDYIPVLVKQTLPEGEMMKQCLEKLQHFVCDSTFFSKMVYLVQPREPVAVLTHGDCWTNNILFHYSETGQILEVVNQYNISKIAVTPSCTLSKPPVPALLVMHHTPSSPAKHLMRSQRIGRTFSPMASFTRDILNTPSVPEYRTQEILRGHWSCLVIIYYQYHIPYTNNITIPYVAHCGPIESSIQL